MKATVKVVAVDGQKPQPGVIALAAEAVHHGKLVVFPTRTLYGLGADAFNARAVDRVFAVKDRDPGKPLLVLIDDWAMLDQVALPLTAAVSRLIRLFWPGKVTFVVPARQGLPHGLTGGTGKIGVRQVAHPVARALVSACGGLLTGTSANPAGAGGCAAVGQLHDSIRDRVSVILDAGTLAGGPGSTVVDVTGDQPTVLRHGVLGEDVLITAWQGVSNHPS